MATIGIDWGGTRVGIALSVSDELASPHGIFHNNEMLMTRICEIVEEYSPARIVLGLPSRERETSETRRIRAFADSLRTKTGLEVILWDESYSTLEADELRRSRNRRSGRRKPIDDQAAAVILQSWIDSGGSDHR